MHGGRGCSVNWTDGQIHVKVIKTTDTLNKRNSIKILTQNMHISFKIFKIKFPLFFLSTHKHEFDRQQEHRVVHTSGNFWYKVQSHSLRWSGSLTLHDARNKVKNTNARTLNLILIT